MASQLENEKKPDDEIPSFLLPYEGNCVLKLLGHNVVKENKSINGHPKSVESFVNSPDLNFSAESMDLIFSNWFSMSLSIVEIKNIAKKLLNWSKVGGYILFPISKNSNTRDFSGPNFFTKVFKECRVSDAYGDSFEFSLVGSKCIKAYELDKKNHNQVWWIWKKVNSKNDIGSKALLDNDMYKSSAILRFERIFGLGFMNVGGIETTKEFVAMLDLKAGHKVLDVGCGTGGSAFYMADNFDVDVFGIDLSINMISFALERAIGHRCSVEFEVADCTKKSYPDSTFDFIYSRDTILHIQDKPALFRSFYKWLKPGGKVLISDFSFRGKTGKTSPNVAKFVNQLGYELLDVEAYCQMFKDAGFIDVVTEDRTQQSEDEFRKHLERLENNKEEFVGDLSEEEYNDFVASWKENFTRIGSGEQKYFICVAKKK